MAMPQDVGTLSGYIDTLHSLVFLLLLVLLSLLSVHLMGPAMTTCDFINMHGLLDMGESSVQHNILPPNSCNVNSSYLQGLPDILDHLVDLEVRDHPKGIGHE